MSYKALYRKYRPQLFSEVVGQAVIVKTLQNAVISGKISHAYLFCGPRGTGKTTVARIFAKALNCANPSNGEPCANCTSCKEIGESMNPDVIEIDAASNNGVDEIRDIREKVKFLPSGAKYKIYIIDEVHMLSTGAFNALLKTLEEPPKHVIFILATTEPQKLPATIISRCQRYDFKPLGTFEISMQLKYICDHEDTVISDDAINAISEAAEGGMRDALSILDQVISYGNKDVTIEDVNTITGTISFDKMNLLMNYIEAKNVNSALETVNDFLQSGKEASKVVSAMLVFCRDILLYKSVGSKNNSKYIFEKEKFQELAFKLSNSKVLYYIDVLSDVLNKVKTSTTPSVYLEITIIKLCNIRDESLDLMKRMSDLEQKIEEGGIATNSETSESNVGDNEKLSLLDTKINQVVAEFNKLELHKLAQRIDDLSQVVANRINSQDEEETKDYSQEIENLKFEIANMQNDSLVEFDNSKFDKLEQEIQELKDSKNDVVSKQLEEKVNAIDHEIASLKSQNSGGDNHDEFVLRLLELEEKVDNLKSFKNNDTPETNVSDYSRLEAEVQSLRNKLDSISINVNNNYQGERIESNDSDLSEIKEKLETLENRMYKFISSAISQTKSKEKVEKKAHGQIMLWGDEIKGLNDIEKISKEEPSFGELEKEEIEQKENIIESNVFEEEKEEVENDIIQNEKLERNEEPSNLFNLDDNAEYAEDSAENESNLQAEEANDDDISEGLFALDEDTNEFRREETSSNDFFKVDESEDESDETNENEEFDDSFDTNQEHHISFEEYQKQSSIMDYDIEDEDEEPEEEHFEEKEIEKEPEEKVKDEIIEQHYNEVTRESVINRTNSSIVIREDNLDHDSQSVSESLLRHESDRMRNIKAETENIEAPQQEIIVKKEEPTVDKFARYDVRDVAQLLCDSQNAECRNDKNRINGLWNSLSRGVSPDQIAIASLLSEGVVVAVGNRELILTYKNVSQCNQVMRSKFKHEAIKILYEKLGDAYNYIALPEKTWLEKRQEYVRQYQMGIKKPILSEFNIEGLNIISDSEEYKTEDERIINDAINFFGSDIVKVKK